MNDTKETRRRPKIWRSILLLVLLLLAYVAYRVMSPVPPPDESKIKPPAGQAAPKIPIAEHFYVNIAKFGLVGQDYSEVIGTVKNISSGTFNYVKVKVEFLDEDGGVVAEETTYAAGQDEFGPDQLKSFKVTVEVKSEYKTVRGVVVEASPVR
jgi:hypothetical protein